jgi:hypothetical protein
MARTARRIAGNDGFGGPWRILFSPFASATRRLCRKAYAIIVMSAWRCRLLIPTEAATFNEMMSPLITR